MKKKISTGIIGFIIGCIFTITMVATPILAAGTTSLIEVVTNSVNVMLDGKSVGIIDKNYTLSNGTQVPFSILYKGTTYLPIRKISELFNKEVGYDGNTRTVNLGAVPVASLPGWYLTDKGFSREVIPFSSGNYSGTSETWESYSSYTTKNDGNIAVTNESYSKDGDGVKRPSTFENASFLWTSPPAFIGIGDKITMPITYTASKEFGSYAFAGFSYKFGYLSPSGDGESYYVSLGENANLMSLPMSEGYEGYITTLTVSLYALGDATQYYYTYEYRE